MIKSVNLTDVQSWLEIKDDIQLIKEALERNAKSIANLHNLVETRLVKQNELNRKVHELQKEFNMMEHKCFDFMKNHDSTLQSMNEILGSKCRQIAILFERIK